MYSKKVMSYIKDTKLIIRYHKILLGLIKQLANPCHIHSIDY